MKFELTINDSKKYRFDDKEELYEFFGEKPELLRHDIQIERLDCYESHTLDFWRIARASDQMEVGYRLSCESCEYETGYAQDEEKLSDHEHEKAEHREEYGDVYQDHIVVAKKVARATGYLDYRTDSVFFQTRDEFVNSLARRKKASSCRFVSVGQKCMIKGR